ncbi:hypothetical protein ACSBR1_003095 [Camellia fascicularis]
MGELCGEFMNLNDLLTYICHLFLKCRKEQDIRVASQLFMLMDSNKPTSRSVPQVVVVASTDRADAIDPALRRSGCFDTEIEFYTKKLPLDPSVDLRSIAASCNGYVGADLEALCCEAAMSAV